MPYNRANTRGKRVSAVHGLGEGRGVRLAVRCFSITSRNLITTLEAGRISTWRLPRFSAFVREIRQFDNTLINTIWSTASAGQRQAGRGRDGARAWKRSDATNLGGLLQSRDTAETGQA